MYRFAGLLLMLVTSGCASLRDVVLVARPTPKAELTTTVVVPIPVFAKDLSGDYFQLAIVSGLVQWSDGGATTRSETKTLRSFGQDCVRLHLRPGTQTLELGGHVSGGGGGMVYYEKKGSSLTLKDFNFQPGQYRVSGKAVHFERLTASRLVYSFDVWLEREREKGVFERVASFDVAKPSD